ncbi:hypothetical protein LSTR_LSTR007907 [Laodelphax striatellus]|uniref:PA domain-containing protein n=1 Tax=Laodelphax striatellus TaxID=195883 RepID=A0A482XL34_LAOST|nr:hypothetical protein LSTR_LSTR007907 [Laodelphax striatellus]
MKLVNDMGITVATLADGRVQLLHTFSNVSARVGVADPLRACDTLTNPKRLKGRIAIVERGDCMFVEKARRLAEAGAVGGIVMDNAVDSGAGGGAAAASPMFAMSGDGTDDVTIPLLFLFSKDAWKLLQALAHDPKTVITMADHQATASTEKSEEAKSDVPKSEKKKEPVQLSTLQQIKGSVQNFLFNDDSSDSQKSPAVSSKQNLVDVVSGGGGEGGHVTSSSTNQGSIRISRRDAYLSSEGTAVVPPFYRQHLRKLLLEMLAKPQAEQWLGKARGTIDRDDLVQFLKYY